MSVTRVMSIPWSWSIPALACTTILDCCSRTTGSSVLVPVATPLADLCCGCKGAFMQSHSQNHKKSTFFSLFSKGYWNNPFLTVDTEQALQKHICCRVTFNSFFVLFLGKPVPWFLCHYHSVLKVKHLFKSSGREKQFFSVFLIFKIERLTIRD